MSKEDEIENMLARLAIFFIGERISKQVKTVFGDDAEFLLIVRKEKETCFHITTLELEDQLDVLDRIKEIIKTKELNKTSLQSWIDKLRDFENAR